MDVLTRLVGSVAVCNAGFKFDQEVPPLFRIASLLDSFQHTDDPLCGILLTPAGVEP